jgi:phosphonate transport system substrate-binding protein
MCCRSLKNVLFLLISFALFLFITYKDADAQESLTLLIHPYLPPTELINRFSPLADYLGKKTGMPVNIQISKDYEEHIDQIGKDRVDIAFMGPASYVKLVDKYGRKPMLARLEINGSPTFRGAVITAKGSRIKTLDDLKGKRFAFGDPNSTMGHLVPRFMMWKAGIDVKDLAFYTFINNHHNVALGVLSGDFDAGAVKDEVFYEYEKRGVRAIAWSPFLSEHLFVTSNSLPKKTVKELKEALYQLKNDKENMTIISRIEKDITGIVPVDDKDYDTLRAVLKTLKKTGVE